MAFSAEFPRKLDDVFERIHGEIGMSSDIKAAFFDIDGTLTSFVTHVVPRSTIDALHALQKKM